MLGPLLFILYINSLADQLTCSWYSFADDFKLYLAYSRDDVDQSTGTSNLQNNLNILYSVAGSWNLKLNPNKCVVMRFGSRIVNGVCSGYMLGGREMKLVDTHRDLGVLVDSSLKFHKHINTIVCKSAGLANQLLRSTVNRSRAFMIPLFVSHIRPILDYCSVVWNTGFLGDLRRLESIQRRWTREIEGLEGMSYTERLKELELYSVYGRLLRADLIKV